MTRIYFTIDTEYAPGITSRVGQNSRRENFLRSIACQTHEGDVGIHYQMNIFDHYGLRAVFFVDPMPALLWGVEAIADIVGPIVGRGHDVQLHLHTEWLELAGDRNPLGKRTGENIKNFTFEEQCQLLDLARAILMSAGAPAPVVFRAGNYGANDDTLRALAHLGIAYDTSHCPGIAASLAGGISLTSADRTPVKHCGVIEVPIGCIGAAGSGLRHAQLTALSADEILAALRHCQTMGIESFTLVSHSFELLSRNRGRINKIVQRRFERLCSLLAMQPDISADTYATHPPTVHAHCSTSPVLRHSPLRTGLRLAEQALANLLYGAR